MTPTKEEIYAKALEMWTKDQYRQGCEALADLTPEYNELTENGYISASQSELMRDTVKNVFEEWKGYNENLENSDLKFDLPEAMKSGVLISGTTGTGKSDLAMYLTDQLTKQGITIIVFDSSQDWLSRSSIAQYQTLTISHIDKIPESSIIFDISRLSVEQRQRVIESFSETIYRDQAMNPSRKQFFLIFEEGSSYFREGFMRGKRFGNTSMLMSEGRNYGVRFMVITQFFASIDKMSMRYMRQRYFGSTNEPRDVEYITRFFSRERKEEIGKTLRSLDAGSFLYMNGSETKRIHIEPYETTIQKRQIVIPQFPEPRLAQLTTPKQETNITTFLRLGMIVCFTVLLLGALR
jgi:DNA helicase HerA-like ATPase